MSVCRSPYHHTNHPEAQGRLSLGFSAQTTLQCIHPMSATGKLVGIDLGTTFSALATLDERGQAVTVPNVEGEMLTPSAVFLEDGCATVGQAARDVALEQPDRVAMIVKRSM